MLVKLITCYITQALLKNGGRTDLRNKTLETIPFHEAIRKKDPALLKVLK